MYLIETNFYIDKFVTHDYCDECTLIDSYTKDDFVSSFLPWCSSSESSGLGPDEDISVSTLDCPLST